MCSNGFLFKRTRAVGDLIIDVDTENGLSHYYSQLVVS